MKFAVCNEMFVDWPFEKAFQFSRETGYTGIELAPFTMGANAYEISAEKRAEVKKQIEEAGCECVGLHWLLAKTEGFYLTTPDAEVRQKTGDYLAELARMCADCGGDIMVLGSPVQRNLLPGVSHDQAMEFAAEVVKIAEPTFRERGVTLALEPLAPSEGDFLNTAELGIELAKMVDSPNVKLHLDVKAMSSESKPIDQIIRDSAEWMVHFHANDANLLGPGMGEIDFDPIFAALKDVGYDGWVSVEVFDYDPGAEKICQDSMNYMRACLDKLG